MVKRVLLLTILALAMPLSAFADSFSEEYFYSGNLLGNSGESFLYGASNITKIVGYPTPGSLKEGSNLGLIDFRTGSLVSGSLEHGGTFSSLGSGFSIWVISPVNGVADQVFSGTFDAPLTWTLTTLANGTHSYVLDGTVSGSTASGFQTAGTVEVSINSGTTLFHIGDTYEVTGGETLIATPEPSSIFLLGTGLVGVVGAVRRKLRR